MNISSHLSFRQVHLDFHTSEAIPGIGSAFRPDEWARTLREAHVNSVTCFSCCHHGWSYHPTRVGAMHPHLGFNLLRAQIDAAHACGIRVPVYLTAGNNQRLAMEHPEWREITPDGRYMGWAPTPLSAGFSKLCLNSGYLEVLRALCEETVELFPDADGIFLDIICQGQCCCPGCVTDMLREGFDPESEADRIRFARRTLLNYYRVITAACRKFNPDMPVFHNSGHIPRGDREILPYFSHLELESLPTGGWGYDHFPVSAAYCRKLPFEFIGMTGKFHSTWGEFGGYKHPDALRYECMAMLANGARCSIGDQLHPDARLDESTYRAIGQAYAEVEAKEAWCIGAESAADIAVLSNSAFHRESTESAAETGCARILQEGHLPFDLLDQEMDFSGYGLVILPDDIRCDAALAGRLTGYLERGGKLLLSGTSGLAADKDAYSFDTGVEYQGVSGFNPAYLQMDKAFAPEWLTSPLVLYGAPGKLRAAAGERWLGKVLNPYFQRSYRHFSSHQHTPFSPAPPGLCGGVIRDNLAVLAFPVFSIYRERGQIALKEFLLKTINALLGDRRQIRCTGLPAEGRLTLMRQPERERTVLHLLYAPKVLKGGGKHQVEVIEELPPAPPVTVELRTGFRPARLRLEPAGTELAFSQTGESIRFTVPAFSCHQMVVAYRRETK